MTSRTPKKMLLSSAGLSDAPEEAKEMFAMDKVLNMTYGLPIAVNAIGGRARFMLEEGGVQSVCIWSTLLDDYKQPEQLLSDIAFHNDQNEKVLSVLLSSLDMIEREPMRYISRSLFTQFCILRKRQHVPFDVVQLLWGLSERETKSQISILRRCNIVELSTMLVGGENKRCIVLHDLYIDLARFLAKGSADYMKDAAKRVLDSYVPDKMETTVGEATVSYAAGASSSVNLKKNSLISMANNVFRKRKMINMNVESSTHRPKRTCEGKTSHELWI